MDKFLELTPCRFQLGISQADAAAFNIAAPEPRKKPPVFKRGAFCGVKLVLATTYFPTI